MDERDLPDNVVELFPRLASPRDDLEAQGEQMEASVVATLAQPSPHPGTDRELLEAALRAWFGTTAFPEWADEALRAVGRLDAEAFGELVGRMVWLACDRPPSTSGTAA